MLEREQAFDKARPGFTPGPETDYATHKLRCYRAERLTSKNDVGTKSDVEPLRHKEHQANAGHLGRDPLCVFVVDSYIGFRGGLQALPVELRRVLASG